MVLSGLGIFFLEIILSHYMITGHIASRDGDNFLDPVGVLPCRRQIKWFNPDLKKDLSVEIIYKCRYTHFSFQL